MPKSPFITTAQLAEIIGVQPATILHNHSKNGHYLGIRPKKFNRLLRWPIADADRLLSTGYAPSVLGGTAR